jgi:hypothetical protein
VERFNLRKPSELEGRKVYQIKITNRFAAVKNLSGSDGKNRAWEDIKGDNRFSAKRRPGL